MHNRYEFESFKSNNSYKNFERLLMNVKISYEQLNCPFIQYEYPEFHMRVKIAYQTIYMGD